jgi:tRNA (guanine-N7-)-methyltransferase
MRNPAYKDEVIEKCTFFYNKEEGFKNNNPIHLEIGMGKGDFIINMALENPNINFVGIEKYSNVAAVAIKKIMNYDIPNLRVLILDAKDLGDYFKHNITRIYLNFSDPWPKKRHARRRLTSHDFLKVYDSLFIDEKSIYLKTDNDDLFNYSLESLEEYGYELPKVCYDLHQSAIPNVLTEYEKKFSEAGVKIKYLEAIKK